VSKPSSESGSRRLAVLNVVGLTSRHLNEQLLPRISRFANGGSAAWTRIEPMLPAVTSSVQATYLTGRLPSHHGIVANGWYDRERDEHLFWKQSDRLVAGPKLWEAARERRPGFTCARLFWWNNMYSSVDFSITPRPIYGADGSKHFDITSKPLEIRNQIKKDLGRFPFPAFWGPMAGIASSDWIAKSARWIEEKHQPDLNLVYLPHLDYNFQRIGPGAPEISEDLRQIDGVVGDLIDFYSERDVDVVLLSEYGITPVDRPVHLNRLFRERGWLQVKNELGREVIEFGDCKALAIADHQVAHVYVMDPAIRGEVQQLLENTEGVEQVMDRSLQSYHGIDHSRSGDFVAVSDARSWFTYYYWEKDKFAPDFARTVDIHRKPGYDPVELFVNPAIRFPKLKVAAKLFRKKLLGQRILMDVIPLDASLVKGSHGRKPEDPADWPVLIGPLPGINSERSIGPLDVYQHLLGAVS
jgi:predicted AlkP superfamily pyrophosphatase or phosphodiesterase